MFCAHGWVELFKGVVAVGLGFGGVGFDGEGFGGVGDGGVGRGGVGFDGVGSGGVGFGGGDEEALLVAFVVSGKDDSVVDTLSGKVEFDDGQEESDTVVIGAEVVEGSIGFIIDSHC